jgi:type II secretory ATPase GspE/PulE/Tfp pilus assembly ATPase PilB-like protein
MEYLMPDLTLASIEYGNYISPVKLVIFLILFFLWLPILNWVFRDTRKVKTKEIFWTAVVFGAGAGGAIIWLMSPAFIIGMLLYIAVVAVAFVSYTKHRDARVADFERILTTEHIKSMFARKQKTTEAPASLAFFTAHNDEAPVPEPNSAEFLGYKTACDIFADAMWRRASNIILFPTSQNYNVTYYIDGAASSRPTIVREHAEYFIHFLKTIANLDVDEKRKPQTGKLIIRKDDKNIEWEATTAGSTAGEQVQLKHITRQELMKLEEIGLSANQFNQLEKICQSKVGLFIVSGPKKSGVTTTFYAMLKKHDPYMFSVSTLEKHPPIKLTDINQNVYALSDTGTITFAKKLQSVIRMEPDVIGVGECTNPETAKVTCAATRNGKIAYLTLEADNVIKTLARWIKLVGDRNLAVETLLGISNQRLIRKLCGECKQAYEPNKELLRKFNIPAEKVKVLYRSGKNRVDKRGKPIICEKCQGTGFIGRICIFEVITMNDQLRSIVKKSKSLSEISTQFRRAKMLYLQEQALKKVIEGTTSINEMVRTLSTERRQKARKPQAKT